MASPAPGRSRPSAAADGRPSMAGPLRSNHSWPLRPRCTRWPGCEPAWRCSGGSMRSSRHSPPARPPRHPASPTMSPLTVLCRLSRPGPGASAPGGRLLPKPAWPTSPTGSPKPSPGGTWTAPSRSAANWCTATSGTTTSGSAAGRSPWSPTSTSSGNARGQTISRSRCITPASASPTSPATRRSLPSWSAPMKQDSAPGYPRTKGLPSRAPWRGSRCGPSRSGWPSSTTKTQPAAISLRPGPNSSGHCN